MKLPIKEAPLLAQPSTPQLRDDSAQHIRYHTPGTQGRWQFLKLKSNLCANNRAAFA